jgi:uncharacterized protein YecE (DUF72 family)
MDPGTMSANMVMQGAENDDRFNSGWSVMSDWGSFRIGTSGWSIPRQQATAFPGGGSHLERYAQVFRATEINSSFQRPHKPQTYARWAASVPADFRFAVKFPSEITHIRKLVGTEQPLEQFLSEIYNLGNQLGPLLLQLPPSLPFVEDVASSFFEAVRARTGGELVCEPRHPSWFTKLAEATLVSARITRVAADPARVPEAARPGGWSGLVYRRLHGSPRMYCSPYNLPDIDQIASEMRPGVGQNRASWCIFDNTAYGEAARNALQLTLALQ